MHYLIGSVCPAVPCDLITGRITWISCKVPLFICEWIYILLWCFIISSFSWRQNLEYNF